MGIGRLLSKGWTALIEDFKRASNASTFQDRYRKHHLQVGRKVIIKRCRFGKYNRVYDNATIVDVSLDDFSYVSEGAHLYNVSIGKFCALGPDVRAGLGMHPTHRFVSIHPVFYSLSNSACMRPFSDKNYFTEHEAVKIGHDVWIGSNAIILDGITIGNGAIVGAASVVTADIPPYGVVAGVPAKLIRYRFDEVQIAFLERFEWWNKDRDWLEQNFKKFHDIEDLMASEADEGLAAD